MRAAHDHNTIYPASLIFATLQSNAAINTKVVPESMRDIPLLHNKIISHKMLLILYNWFIIYFTIS